MILHTNDRHLLYLTTMLSLILQYYFAITIYSVTLRVVINSETTIIRSLVGNIQIHIMETFVKYN